MGRTIIHRTLLGLGFAAGLTLGATLPLTSAQAQTAPTVSTPSDSQATTPRPRRERSEAQRRNDQVMRDCGTEWRAGKTALQAQGKTWRTFLSECRARRRA